jgi:hypothetical protein
MIVMSGNVNKSKTIANRDERIENGEGAARVEANSPRGERANAKMCHNSLRVAQFFPYLLSEGVDVRRERHR